MAQHDLIKREFEDAISRFAGKSTSTGEDAYLTKDLCEMTGKSPEWVRNVLKILIESGEWESTMIQTHTISGRRQTVPAYRPVKKVPVAASGPKRTKRTKKRKAVRRSRK